MEKKIFFTDFVITKKFICPACGEIIFGFEASCPDCGINFGTYTFSVSGFKGLQMKYFYLRS